MTVTAVIQARMGSSRLPGKVLQDLGGRPLLGFLLHRLEGVNVDHLVVATSDTAADDAVAQAARAAGADVVRGPEADVLERFSMALDAFPADTLVRLTADCPLLEPGLVHQALAAHRDRGAAYTSNTLVRTYPDGLDVEVLDSAVLRTAVQEATDRTEREHVTPFVYRRPERFRLATFRTDLLAGDERWTLDTEDDLRFLREVVRSLPNERTGWEEILDRIGRRNDPLGDEVRLRPAVADDSTFVLDLRNDPVAVRYSGTGTAADPVAHRSWFAQRLVDPSSRLWIGVAKGGRVGQVRVDVRSGVGTVSIAVAAKHRGQGHAAAMLRDLRRVLAADQQVLELQAVVHRDNEASMKLFATAGFVEGGRAGDLLHLSSPR